MWDEANFKKRFSDMKNLVKEVGLLPADESKVLTDLNDWETKGTEVFILFECISTPGRLEKYAWPRRDLNLRPLEY